MTFIPQTGARPLDRCSSYVLPTLASLFSPVSMSLRLPFDLAPPRSQSSSLGQEGRSGTAQLCQMFWGKLHSLAATCSRDRGGIALG